MNTNTKDLILESTLKLVNREGLYHLNMKKLAKEAGLAIGTAYIYFDSKETIINELYQKIVRESEVAVFKNFQSERPLKETAIAMMRNLVTCFVSNPDYFSFIEQYGFSPILLKESKEKWLGIIDPLTKLIEKGKNKSLLKNLPTVLLLNLAHGPIIGMLKAFINNQVDLTDEWLQDQLFEACWKSIASENIDPKKG
ncbi:TetR/AcrR family transcriptional regulator [Cytophagaceae bacterium YF14B1]|uniref:TetR/AcrR family transcriptional regulator n=1 Tax=Xanthocytophaga flava TaxID=3048013 RepID=A0AAE3U760_9BACT|nr:TetR/AcrR family transcriptional regulator [Xanthocytophaga flavus]MDJ1482579.1 TetR/AcrR family transcriptional regulator [Xanthocytophaga flavus]